MKNAVPWTAAATAIALGVLVFSDGTAEIVGFELLLLIVVIVALRPAVRTARVPVPEFEFRRVHTLRLPPQLVELERLVAFSQTSRVDFDRRLLPRLRAVAGDRLLARHGIDLEGDPQAAARFFGSEAWELLYPAGGPADDVALPGPSTGELEQLVMKIENLADEGEGPV